MSGVCYSGCVKKASLQKSTECFKRSIDGKQRKDKEPNASGAHFPTFVVIAAFPFLFIHSTKPFQH